MSDLYPSAYVSPHGLTDADVNRMIGEWLHGKCVWVESKMGLWGWIVRCQHGGWRFWSDHVDQACRTPDLYCTDWNALMRALWRVDMDPTAIGVCALMLDNIEGGGNCEDSPTCGTLWMVHAGAQAVAHALARAIKAQKEATNA